MKILDLGKESAGQHFKRARHELAELVQRWDHRLILKRCSFPKAYIHGRVAILLVVKVGGGTGGDRNVLCLVTASCLGVG